MLQKKGRVAYMAAASPAENQSLDSQSHALTADQVHVPGSMPLEPQEASR